MRPIFLCLVLVLVSPLPAGAQPSYERAEGAEGTYGLRAKFQNFNNDALTLEFNLHPDTVAESLQEFGYDKAEIDQLLASCTGCDQAEFDKRSIAFYESRAISAQKQPDGRVRLSVDIRAVVERNKARVRPLAEALGELARQHNYGPDQTLGAAVSFVQTALKYEQPPSTENGRNIIGFYPPPRALELGLGDCDTKSALLAAMLKPFSGIRMVGVHVPKHYLVGVARVPRHGDAFIEYKGEPFVLMEASGPAWRPPGFISDTTKAALATMQGVRIDPLF